MATNADLERVIALLTELKGRLDATSAAAERAERMLGQLGTASQSQIAKLNQSLTTGQGTVVNLGGQRFRTGELASGTRQGIDIKDAAETQFRTAWVNAETQLRQLVEQRVILERNLNTTIAQEVADRKGEQTAFAGIKGAKSNISSRIPASQTLVPSSQTWDAAAVSTQTSVESLRQSFVNAAPATNYDEWNSRYKALQSQLFEETKRNALARINAQNQATQRRQVEIQNAPKVPAFGVDTGVNVTTSPRVDPFGGEIIADSYTKKEIASIDKIIAKSQRENVKAIEDENKAREKLAQQYNASLNKVTAERQPIPRGAVEQRFPQQAAQIYGMAGEAGFAPENLKSFTLEGKSKIGRLQFEKIDDQGVIQRATYTVDQYGQVLQDTQRRFRSFGETVQQDLVKVTQWSIAIGILYGGMYQLQQLITTMITNETKLAETMTVLGNSTKNVADVFAVVARVSNETGESITGIIDGFRSAYQATGGMTSATERFALASKVLKDSIVLSKISTLDQAEATDVLTAALRQSSEQLGDKFNNSLEGGEYVLDRWVKTTRVANVDVATLATSFGVVGEAANTAGLSLEETNAVIAILSESAGLAGKEAANAARAIISGFASDKATKAMEQYGLSMTKSNGEMKNFVELATEINQKKASGILSPEAFQDIAYAIGGGSRRGAVVQTFVQNISRLQPITEAQDATKYADVTGAAMKALGIQTDTVQTSTTRLGNAFQTLAETLGTEGGILSDFKTLVNLTTLLVRGLDEIAAVAGKAGPILALAFGARALFGSMAGQKQLGNIAGGIGNIATALVNPFMMGQTAQVGTRVVGGIDVGGISIGGSTTPIMGPRSVAIGQNVAAFMQNKGLAYAGAGLGVGLTAGQNIASGEVTNAAGNAIGAAFGAVVGGPVGMLIGSTIGDAIVTTIKGKKADIAEVFAILNPETAKKATEEQNKGAQTQEDIITEAYKRLGFGNADVGQFIVGLGGLLGGNGLTRQERRGTGFLGTQTSNEALAGWLTEDERRRIALAEAGKGTRSAQFLARQAATTGGDEAILKMVQDETSAKLLSQLTGNVIKPTAYNQKTEALKGFDAIAKQWRTAFGDEFLKTAGNITSWTEAYKMMANVIVNSSAEEIQYLNDLANAQAETSDPERVKNAGTYFQKLIESNRQSMKITLPGVTDLSQYKMEDINRALAGGLANQDVYLQATIRDHLVPDGTTVKDIQDTYADIFIKMPTGEYLKKSGLDPKFIQEWLTQNNIQPQANVGFQTFDATQAQLQRAISGVPTMVAQLQAINPAYKPDMQDQLAITKEGYMMTAKTDWKIVQYLLGKILETEQKQLTGLYNLPEGAGIFVPYEAAMIKPSAAPVTGTGNVPVTEKGQTYPSPTAGFMPDTRTNLPILNPTPAAANPYGPPTWLTNRPPTEISQEWQREERKINYGTMTGTYLPGGQGLGIPERPQTFADQWNEFTNFFKMLGNNITTKIGLNLTITSTLMADGRVLASVIKPYLTKDLTVQAGQSTSTSLSVV